MFRFPYSQFFISIISATLLTSVACAQEVDPTPIFEQSTPEISTQIPATQFPTPTPVPTPTSTVSTPIPTKVPTPEQSTAIEKPDTPKLSRYESFLSLVGYPEEIADGVSSLDSNEINEFLANELLLIGNLAAYAIDTFAQTILPMLGGEISASDLAFLEDIDGDGLANSAEIIAGSNVLDPFNLLPANAEALAVLGNRLYPVVAVNGELVYEFDLHNFLSLFKGLTDAPYADRVLARITNSDDGENVSQAWNYKVRREDEVLFSILGLSSDDAEGWQFRWDNGAYHLESWVEYVRTGETNSLHIMPLDNAGIGEWFKEEEDAEFALMQLWVPESMTFMDLTTWQNNIWLSRYPEEWRVLRNNMDVILGKRKINGLDQYENLRDRILSVADNHEIYRWPRQQWFPFIGEIFANAPGENYVGKEFQRDIEPVLNDWEHFKIAVKLPYDLAIYDGLRKAQEPDDTRITPIYTKALGLPTYDLHARYPEYTGIHGDHQILGWTVPSYVMERLEGKKIYPGQVVSLLSAIDGAQRDGIPYILGPASVEIIWRNPR